MRSLISAAAFIAVVLLSCACGSSQTWPFVGTPPSPFPHPTPLAAGGAYFGGFFGQSQGLPADLPAYWQRQETNTESLESQAGRNFAVMLQYGTPYYFYNGTMQTDPRVSGDLAHHRIPYFSWTCAWNMTSYLNGSHDAYIDATAYALKSLNVPVFFRPFHEFNLCLTPNNCANGDYGSCFTQGQTTAQQQAEFITWWKYIYTRMVTIDGATNLVWIWCPAVGPASPFSLATLSGFLPTSSGNPNSGSVVDVDYIGFDIYDKSATTGLVNLIQNFYSYYAAYNIPMAWSESGEDSSACVTSSWTQAQWFTDLVNNMGASFPLIRLYSYFDSWYAYPNCNTDWILDAGGQSGLITAAQNAYFSPMAY